MEVVAQSPYDISGEAVFNGTMKGNLYSSLQSLPTSASGMNSFLKTIAENKECSINNIVCVFCVPGEWANAVMNGGLAMDSSETIPAVNVAAKQLPSMI